MKFYMQAISAVVILSAIVICGTITTVRAAPANDMTPASHKQLPADADSAIDTPSNNPVVRSKRAIIFRPVFVYRQQQIKKQLVEDRVKLPKSNPDKLDFNYYAGQEPARQF